MAEHTPGPWVWDWGRSDSLYSKAELDRVSQEVKEGLGWLYAKAIVETDGRQYGPNDADAALIAAAPDLLVALKILVGQTGEGMLFSERMRIAVAAIAKAEGKP